MGEQDRIFIILDDIRQQLNQLIGEYKQQKQVCHDHAQKLRDLEMEQATQSKQFYSEMEKMANEFKLSQQEQGKRIGELERLADSTISLYRAEKQAQKEIEDAKREVVTESKQYFTSWRDWVLALVAVGSSVAAWYK